MKGRTRGRTAEGGTSVRGRHNSRRGNRLAARQASHREFPVSADGKQWSPGKPQARRPGSRNPAKH